MSTPSKTDSPGDSDAVGAWFLGPRGENSSSLSTLLSLALNHHVDSRESYFPDDPSAITTRMKTTNTYKENIRKLFDFVNYIAPKLSNHSVPFWSPRYNAHMNMDTSMPGIVGYFTTMLTNPNNVAVEASPLTTAFELAVGQQLCELVGFNTEQPGGPNSPEGSEKPVGWGHITCDGSVANLESMWAARNLKFYPLSLRLAMQKELSFIADSFYVRTCAQDNKTAPNKLLKDFDEWDLINITPGEVLDIPTRLNQQYGITAPFLQRVLETYSIQSVGKDCLERKFGIKPMAYFASTTMHYSWPKGAAITGIGRDNFIRVGVDNSARMDIDDLRDKLQDCLDKKRAVYAVVAIIGSTEHGACDQLMGIIGVREEFQRKGLSFVLHADGAWGTYFLSTISKKDQERYLELGPVGLPQDDFVPALPLKPKTIQSLVRLRYCDSITVDPHKSGYLQYPAGGLLYRDQRMRFLVTWTSPIVYRNDLESVGVYGVEGSKPGAVALAAWGSHEIIGLHPGGYGQLLGQATFSAVKMYAHLATMSLDDPEIIVTPLNLLPAEETGGNVEKQRKFIREQILLQSNRDLVNDKDAWWLVCQMGSDLSINAFAVNFKIRSPEGDGSVPNQNVFEANYLNKRIFERLSITDVEKNNVRPLILTSTQLSQEKYGDSLKTFKKRLELPPGDEDLYVLVNVVMSPWPTASGLTNNIARELEAVIRKEREVLVYRNTLTSDFHGFVMQGTTNRVFLVHLAMFNMENHRQQLILSGRLADDVMQKYIDARKAHPQDFLTLRNKTKTTLKDIIAAGSLDVVIDIGIPSDLNAPHVTEGKLMDIEVVAQRSLAYKDLVPYPSQTMPFFLYGTDTQQHIDHVYTAFPNVQMTAEQVDIGEFTNDWSERPLIYAQLPFPEAMMHPFPRGAYLKSNTPLPHRFRPGEKFDKVVFTADLDGKVQLGTGTIVLSNETPFIDADMLNDDPEMPGSMRIKESSTERSRYYQDMIGNLSAKVNRTGEGVETELALPGTSNGPKNVPPSPRAVH